VEAALLDPESDWLRISGGGWEAARVRRWHGSFEMVPVVYPQPHLRMNDLHRLRSMGGGRWVAFSQYPDDVNLLHRGEVVRIGPGRLQRIDTPAGGDPSVLLELCDGRKLNVAEVDDVLLRSPLGLQEQPCQ